MTPRGCARHLDTLTELEAGFDVPGAVADRARAHLEGCEVCRHRLEETALAIVGLRRLRVEVEIAEPSAEAWDRLQRRVITEAAERVAPAQRRLPLGFPMLSALTAGFLVIALAIPAALGPSAAPQALVEPGTQLPALTTGVDGRLPVELVRPLGDGPAPLPIELFASDPVDAIQPAARSLLAEICPTSDAQGGCPTGGEPLPGGSHPTEGRL